MNSLGRFEDSYHPVQSNEYQVHDTHSWQERVEE